MDGERNFQPITASISGAGASSAPVRARMSRLGRQMICSPAASIQPVRTQSWLGQSLWAMRDPAGLQLQRDWPGGVDLHQNGVFCRLVQRVSSHQYAVQPDLCRQSSRGGPGPQGPEQKARHQQHQDCDQCVPEGGPLPVSGGRSGRCSHLGSPYCIISGVQSLL